jgi:hypothetical protein
MQTDRLKEWIKNTNSSKTNQEVLFIKGSCKHTQYNLLDLKRVGNSFQSNIKLFWLDEIKEVKYRYYCNQIVVMLSQDMKQFETIKKTIARDVIYVDDSESINKIIELLKEKTVDIRYAFQYELLKKEKFEEILQLDKESLERFIINRNILLSKIHFGFEAVDITLLNDYLTIYSLKKVLLAKFAHYLYRLTTLDFTSTVKSAGASIHTTFGVQSKIINLKSLKIRVTTSLIGNHRVYDLNENQIQTDIKMGIAKKLVALDLKELDVSKIANITELPLKQIEKMHRACFIR